MHKLILYCYSFCSVCSLVSETIPYHRDYQIVLPKERILYKKVTCIIISSYCFLHVQCRLAVMWSNFIVVAVFQKLLNILDELESIKPEVDRRVKEHNQAHSGAQLLQLDGPERTSYGSQASLGWHSENIKLSSTNVKQAAYQVNMFYFLSSLCSFSRYDYLIRRHFMFFSLFVCSFSFFLLHCVDSIIVLIWFYRKKLLQPTSTASQSSWTYNNDYSWVPENSMQIDKQFQKLWV